MEFVLKTENTETEAPWDEYGADGEEFNGDLSA